MIFQEKFLFFAVLLAIVLPSKAKGQTETGKFIGLRINFILYLFMNGIIFHGYNLCHTSILKIKKTMKVMI